MTRFVLPLLVALFVTPAMAQQNRTTINGSVSITTGGTFQQILAANARWSVTVENNNTNTDKCWIYIGAGTASEAASIMLLPGGSYTRYSPFIPSDEIQATCAAASDTLYVDTQ